MEQTTAAASALNVHTPERQPGESQTQYRERQKHSRAAAKAMQRNRGGKTTGREDLRDAQRRNGSLDGTFGRGLIRAAARKRAEAMQEAGAGLRDAHGALTITGSVSEFVDTKPGSRFYELGGSAGPDGFTKTARRIWLAGISASRGY